MRIITANNKQKLVMCRSEWEHIGSKAGWLKIAKKVQYSNIQIIEPEEVSDILESFVKRRFYIEYRKKGDESLRPMQCQRGVDKMSEDPTYVPNPQFSTMMRNKGLICVYDLKEAADLTAGYKAQGFDDKVAKLKAQRKAYRWIYPTRVELIHGNKTEYLVTTAIKPEIQDKIEQIQSGEITDELQPETFFDALPEPEDQIV